MLTAVFRQCELQMSSRANSCVPMSFGNDTLKHFVVSCCAVEIPHGDAVSEDVLHGAAVESHQ